MTGYIKIYHLAGILYLLIHIAIHPVIAQSGQLQLNILLEPDQTLDWTREYPVHIAEGIPATIVLGKIAGENTLVGIFKTEGTGLRLVLHGIQNKNKYILREWVDNNTETGSVVLQNEEESVWGFWYNKKESLRLEIRSVNPGPQSMVRDELRQYQNGDFVFFTRYNEQQESVLQNLFIDSAMWMGKYLPHKQCYNFQAGNRSRKFCRTGDLGVYFYSHVDLTRIIYGYVPQIPHDETFNSKISKWLSQWAKEALPDTLGDLADQRWSRRQAIRFIPDYIGNDLVSGLLSIQYSGDGTFHARSVIYDRKKNVFYQPEDFFRSHTSWNEDFQQTAQKYFYEEYEKILEMFPGITDRIRYHMTVNPKGLIISTDFTPYFGRLEIQLNKEEIEDDLQRFAPFRKFILD